ncbi:MAG: twin-arginine translocase TatA/TatE family subunit [Desulfobacterales bacterium]|jgi:sec-independent protein translocase protein TatB|nr:twin-arginine translocase TatA/TatE family subunit [Desulfobacterales bacterium]
MFGIGMPEMLLIMAVALIIIGPKKLPDLAKSLGRAIGEFRKATSDLKDSIVPGDDLENVKTTFKDLNKEVNAPLNKSVNGPDPTPEAGKKPDNPNVTPPSQAPRDTGQNA